MFVVFAAAASVAQAQEAAPPPPAAPASAAAPAPLPADQAAFKSHVLFLASDQMRGREAGSAEYDIAAQYVASQFHAAGLQPAGDAGSYLQKVPLVSYRPSDKGSFAVSAAGGAATPLTWGEDYLPGANPAQANTQVDAPVVFVGYGVVAPQIGRDDYAGVDVRGKIVAIVPGAPASLNGEERAHLGNGRNKAVIAAQKGAVGIITLQSPPAEAARPFARQAEHWQDARMTWAHPDGKGFIEAANTPGLAAISTAGAARLFGGASAWAKAARGVDARRFRARELPVRLRASFATEIKPATSYNVAGLLPGSDPALSAEVVVLTAHLDHVGVGAPNKAGDTIYNGAMDNAVGIASLIEEAKRFKAAGAAPKRSVMFVAVTAEEKGLVGSDYFARHPTVAKERLVANVNLDMPIITYKFTDVIAFGSDRTTLGPIVRRAAADAGATFSPDPMPDQGLFVRSDHYRFVQQGVPSVFLWPGKGGPGGAAVDAFFAQHYHQPSDAVEQTPAIDWESGTRFVNVNYQIARDIADAPERPRWNKGDYFGLLYEGVGAK